jgi:hypothetical protein
MRPATAEKMTFFLRIADCLIGRKLFVRWRVKGIKRGGEKSLCKDLSTILIHSVPWYFNWTRWAAEREIFFLFRALTVNVAGDERFKINKPSTTGWKLTRKQINF